MQIGGGRLQPDIESPQSPQRQEAPCPARGVKSHRKWTSIEHLAIDCCMATRIAKVKHECVGQTVFISINQMGGLGLEQAAKRTPG